MANVSTFITVIPMRPQHAHGDSIPDQCACHAKLWSALVSAWQRSASVSRHEESSSKDETCAQRMQNTNRAQQCPAPLDIHMA